MQYLNGNFQDFKDQTMKALKHKMINHPVMQEYLQKMNTLQGKIDKFKEIQSMDKPATETGE